MRPLLIDTDTASDDAVALVMALRDPGVDVEAITVVAGNVALDQAVQNALYTVELCGASTPVFAGRSAPLLRSLTTAQFVHGNDGMGDIGLALSGREPAAGRAVDVILDVAERRRRELTMVTLGPLTNVAVALLREPELARWVGHCYVMGGTSDNVGNMGVVGEFNVWVDPEAARIVFESGMPITMIGWDISRKYAVISHAEQDRWRAIDTDLARFCLDIQTAVDSFAIGQTHLAGFDLPDPIAMAVALDESVIGESVQRFVTVETGDGPSRGQTVIDHFGMLDRPATTRVVTAADPGRFRELLYRSMR